MKIIKNIVVVILALLATLFLARWYFSPSYLDAIYKYSKEYNVNPALVCAVIETESEFDPNVVSNKGAVGLMQIMPESGKWIADTIGVEDFDESMLYNPETNIQLGTWYLSYLISTFEDSDQAICAYNAGPTNVKKWIEDEQYYKDGTLHTIPFNETKNYLKKVTIFYYIYYYLFAI